MNDFEKRIKDLLNEQVDAQVGERRPAPGFDRAAASSKPARAGRRGGPWLMPLLAAACVAAVVGGTAGASALLADDKHNAPATQVPNPTATRVPSPATPFPSPTGTSHSTAPGPHRVSLGGASIRLPSGWVARDFSQYLRPDEGTAGAQQWCLTPASLPPSTEPGACPLTLGTIVYRGNAVDVDIQGGWSSNPHYCYGPTTTGRSVTKEQTGDRSFGNRVSDWRRWDITCPGHHYQIEQYVVATGPGYILFSEKADSTVRAAMTEIADHSALPAATAAVRFMDRGIVRTIQRTSSGVRIALDRVVATDDGIVNNNPATYDYTVPTPVFDRNQSGGNIKVGTQVYLYSDGSTVLDIYRD